MDATTQPALEAIDENTALVTIEQASALGVFRDSEKLDELLLNKVREYVAERQITDTSTAENRAHIKALAYKITRTKTAVEAVGKTLADELKALPKLIDANRKYISEQLATLAEEVRRPVTEYEAEQKRIKAEKAAAAAAIEARKQAIQQAIDGITRAPLDLIGKPAADIRAKLDELEANPPTADAFDDRVAEAQERWKATTAQLLQMAEQQEALDAQERERIEREAAARAAEAERERARREQQEAAVAAERRAAAQAAEAERQRLEKEAAERRAAEAEAESRRLAAEAEQRAQQAAAQAAEAERQRIAAEQEAARQAEEARAANAAHRKAINNAAVNALIGAATIDGQKNPVSLTIPQAQAVIIAISSGKIPNVTISY